jgi:hypothetical protein
MSDPVIPLMDAFPPIPWVDAVSQRNATATIGTL